MAIDIKTIGTVKHKDGSTEDVICFGKTFKGIIFETLQGNRYLYRDYCDEYDNIFNNSFLHRRCNQLYKFDHESCDWIDATYIIDIITIIKN